MTHAGGVLVIWPPDIPSYFNAGHHLSVFMTAAYLRRARPGWEVTAIDAGALNVHLKSIADTLYQGEFDLVAVANDLDALSGLPRFTEYVRELLPNARIVTFGRLSSMHSDLFTQLDLDGIVWSGDYECGITEAVDLVASGEWQPRPGLRVRLGTSWSEPTIPGQALSPEDWALPDIREIPYEAYGRLYARDEAKFCGIPERRELVVPVARGCPVGCSFCDVPSIFGLRERRLPVETAVAYIDECFAAAPFEYVAFYAPTFTLHRSWVMELCEHLVRGHTRPKWKCATTIRHLDEALLSQMGEAGCVRVSVGLETLEGAGQETLPRQKRYAEEDFRRAATWCDNAGIELNAFVIVGLPGTSVEGTARTIEFARSVGARVRPTVYTPYVEMPAGLSIAQASRYNRQFLHDPGGHDPADWYRFIFGSGFGVTAVQNRIPRVPRPGEPQRAAFASAR